MSLAVQPDGAADDRGIAAEPPPPERFRENDHSIGAGPLVARS